MKKARKTVTKSREKIQEESRGGRGGKRCIEREGEGGAREHLSERGEIVPDTGEVPEESPPWDPHHTLLHILSHALVVRLEL